MKSEKDNVIKHLNCKLPKFCCSKIQNVFQTKPQPPCTISTPVIDEVASEINLADMDYATFDLGINMDDEGEFLNN